MVFNLKKLRAAAVVLIGIALLAVINTAPFLKPSLFQVSVLDVGQGDAILISTPEKINVLIDGGPKDTVLAQLPKQIPYFDQRIDLIILTHPDADHLEGLISVIKKYKIGMVIMGAQEKETAVFKSFQEVLRQKQIPQEEVFTGDVIKLGKETKFAVLWPPQDLPKDTKTNEASIAGLLSYRGYDFLLTGDLGNFAESRIISFIDEKYYRAEVLKVGHHGSAGSSSLSFLKAVQPRIAAVSAGKNNLYGHPSPAALARLQEAGAKVFRTDLMGTIDFIVNQKGLIITTEN